jgi:hypothetical protein
MICEACLAKYRMTSFPH